MVCPPPSSTVDRAQASAQRAPPTQQPAPLAAAVARALFRSVPAVRALPVARAGERCSTAAAYLEPAMEAWPGRLTLVGDVSARRVLWEAGGGGVDGDASPSGPSGPPSSASPRASAAGAGAGATTLAPPVARGVECVSSRGEVVAFEASKEVLICAGAIASPQLLQLSGVGPPDLLSRLGIPLIADRPGVWGPGTPHQVPVVSAASLAAAWDRCALLSARRGVCTVRGWTGRGQPSGSSVTTQQRFALISPWRPPKASCSPALAHPACLSPTLPSLRTSCGGGLDTQGSLPPV